MSGSRTKYYVSSSTFPMFDDSARINQFAAAMLDYTANSSVEQSEYIKSYYDVSRLRNYRGYLNWCTKNNFYSIFGNINADFYTDAKLDNTVVGDAIKHLVTLGENDKFGVYRSKLSFFSEDFYVKYLATQQGVSDKFYEDGDLYYTIDYPTDTTIRATLEDGFYVEGPLPTGSLNTRFIEISYSIIREIINKTPDTEIKDPITGEITVIPGEVFISYKSEYGFYHYQEGSGNLVLDSLIKNNNSKIEKSFFPPIPLRANTSWYTGDEANKINEALIYLGLYNQQKDKNNAYEDLKKNLTEGMKEGSMEDIDYITMLPGVVLNSDNNSDKRYLFEFFYNLYLNYALKVARPDPSVPKTLYSGSNYIEDFASYAKKGFANAGYSDGYFTEFKLNCDSSNLNLIYSWGHSDYFEHNGQWKPDAKIGDYGVLCNTFNYTYTYTYESYEQVGSGDDSYYDWVTKTAKKTVPYTLTAFCHQTSKNRFRMTIFVGLTLTNLVYHGKTISTSAWDAINAATVKEDISISFLEDVGSADKEYSNIIFKWVKATGEIDTPFIVPLEKNTFHEVGYTNQLEISYGSQFIVINCWEKKKVRWYERGFLGKVLAFVGLVIGIMLCLNPFTAPFGIAMVIYFGVICVKIMLERAFKILCAIFGDRLGAKIYTILLNVVKSILSYVAAVCRYIPVIGWIIYGICMAAYFFITTAEYMRLGLSMGDALKYGVVETAVAAIGSYAAGAGGQVGNTVSQAASSAAQSGAGALGQVGAAMSAVSSSSTVVMAGISAATQGFGNAIIQGKSFGSALKTGLKAGAISAATAAVVQGVGEYFNLNSFTPSQGIDPIDVIIKAETKGAFAVVSDAITSAAVGILKNPNTWGNLLNMAIEERYYHKLANLENDYQEFNNQLKAIYDTLEVLKTSVTSTATAEFVCKLQTNLNRTAADPDNLVEPAHFLNMGLMSGSDMVKTVLSSPSIFAEDKLSMDGYSPSSLYFTQTDYTVSWDI